MADSRVAVRSPDDWVRVSDRELANIAGSYTGHVSNDSKIDHALKATEAMLKAIIWKEKKWPEWPTKGKGGTKYLYSHNFDAMLDQTGLRERLRASEAHWTSWLVILNAAVKALRYSPDDTSDAEANAVAKAVRYPDTGILPWLRARYHEMQ